MTTPLKPAPGDSSPEAHVKAGHPPTPTKIPDLGRPEDDPARSHRMVDAAGIRPQ